MKLLYKLALSLAVFIGINTTIAEAARKSESKTIFNHNNSASSKAAGVEKDFQTDISAKGAAQEKKLDADANHHVQGCTVTDANKEAETIAAAILAKKVQKVDFNKMFLAQAGKNNAHAGKSKLQSKDKAHASKKSKKATAGKKGKKSGGSKKKKSAKKR